MVFYEICVDFIQQHQPLLYSHLLIIIIFFGLAVGLVPWIMNNIKEMKTKEEFKSFCIKVFIIAIFILPIFLAKMYTQNVIFPKWTKFVRSRLVEMYLEKNKIEFKDANVSSDIVTLFEVAEQTNIIFNWMITIFVPVIISVLCLNAYMYFIDPVIGFMCTCTTALIAYYLLLKIESMSRLYQEKQVHYKNMISQLDNTYTNLFNVYLNDKIGDTVEQNNAIECEYESKINKSSFQVIRFAFILRFFSYLFIMATLFYIYMRSKTSLPESFYTIMTLIFFYVSRVDELTESVPLYLSKIVELKLHEPMFRVPVLAFEPFSEIKGDIRFDNVSFGYNETQTIQNFSLEVKAGQRVGIIGETGTGKTTLMKLLLKFYTPSSGDIYMDGRNLNTIHPDDIRKQMYYINQRTMLFNDSLLNNLRYGTLCTEEEVVAFLKRYDLESVFQQRGEDWLTTPVETNGSNISMGMQKVIFLVRGMLHKAPLYLIDEPFTSIDANSRSKVLRLMDEETRGKTVLIITHDHEGLDDILDETIVLQKIKNE